MQWFLSFGISLFKCFTWGKKIVKFKWYLSWFLEEKLIIKERRKEREKKKVYKIILDARKRFYYYFIFAFPFLEGETSLQGF